MMTVKMTDVKQTEPTVVGFSPQDAIPTPAEAPTKSGRLSRKHVLIAVVSVIIAGLVVTAVLVGIRMITSSNEEILKLSISLKERNSNGSQQTISTDANANIVIYRIKENGLDVTVNDDFDKDIQLMKIVSGPSVECYVTPLNRSNAFDLKSLPLPSDYNPSTTINVTAGKTVRLSYDAAPTPISDTTFLGKRANAVCSNIPIYWLRPSCDETVVESSTAVGNHTRSKRGFGCSCGLKQCESCIRVFGKKICAKYPCGFECKCCYLRCLNLDKLNPCVACWLLGANWGKCYSVCDAILKAVS